MHSTRARFLIAPNKLLNIFYLLLDTLDVFAFAPPAETGTRAGISACLRRDCVFVALAALDSPGASRGI